MLFGGTIGMGAGQASSRGTRGEHMEQVQANASEKLYCKESGEMGQHLG